MGERGQKIARQIAVRNQNSTIINPRIVAI